MRKHRNYTGGAPPAWLCIVCGLYEQPEQTWDQKVGSMFPNLAFMQHLRLRFDVVMAAYAYNGALAKLTAAGEVEVVRGVGKVKPGRIRSIALRNYSGLEKEMSLLLGKEVKPFKAPQGGWPDPPEVVKSSLPTITPKFRDSAKQQILVNLSTGEITKRIDVICYKMIMNRLDQIEQAVDNPRR